MDSLPREIVFEILSRLTVKSVIVMKSSCKWLYYVTRTTDFINRHMKHNKNYSLLVDHSMTRRTGYSHISVLSVENSHICESRRLQMLKGCEPNFLFQTQFSKECLVLGSCNGVVCVRDLPYKNLMLWNPLINQRRLLPEQLYQCDQEKKDIFFTVAVGIGFDNNNNDLKVVTIQQNKSFGSTLTYEAEIYSSRLDCWSQINDIPQNLGLVSHGICSGNKYFWWWQGGQVERGIICFDFKEETFSPILLPPTIRSGLPLHKNDLTDYEGQIAIVNQDQTEKKTHTYIWVLKEEQDGIWEKKAEIEKLGLDESVIGFWSKSIVFISKGRNEIKAVSLVNVLTGEASLFPIVGSGIYNHKESFLPVKRVGGPDDSSSSAAPNVVSTSSSGILLLSDAAFSSSENHISLSAAPQNISSYDGDPSSVVDLSLPSAAQKKVSTYALDLSVGYLSPSNDKPEDVSSSSAAPKDLSSSAGNLYSCVMLPLPSAAQENSSSSALPSAAQENALSSANDVYVGSSLPSIDFYSASMTGENLCESMD